MDRQTLKAIQLALEFAWEKAHDRARECVWQSNRDWLFGFTAAITTVQCALNECGTLPIENACVEIGGMK